MQADVADLQQRLRVATEALRHDLLAAGAGAVDGPLADVFAPILPARTGSAGADPELPSHADRISITYVPDTRSQTALTIGMAVDRVRRSRSTRTRPGAPRMARAASGVVIGRSSSPPARTISSRSPTSRFGATVSAAATLSYAYPAGSRVAGVVHRVYYLDRPGKRLMVYDGDRSDLPLVDHVVDLRFTYYVDPAAAPFVRRRQTARAARTRPGRLRFRCWTSWVEWRRRWCRRRG